MYPTATSLPVQSRALPLGLLAAAGFLSSAGARAVDALLALIAQDFETSVSAVSVVLAAFSVSYGIFQLVLGPLSDSFGKLRLILLALIGYTTFTGACALASDVTSLTVLRACSGAASAGLIPVCLAYIGDTVPYERRQLTLSRFLVGVMLAQTIAGPLSGGFGQYIGWRGVFLPARRNRACCWPSCCACSSTEWPTVSEPARSPGRTTRRSHGSRPPASCCSRHWWRAASLPHHSVHRPLPARGVSALVRLGGLRPRLFRDRSAGLWPDRSPARPASWRSQAWCWLERPSWR